MAKNDGPCLVVGCGKPAYQRLWCHAHYQRWYRTGDPLGARQRRTAKPPSRCAIGGCEKVAKSGRSWCPMHCERQRLHGSFDDPRPTSVERVLARITVDENSCWWYEGDRWVRRSGRLVDLRRILYEDEIAPLGPDQNLWAPCGCDRPAHNEPVGLKELHRRSGTGKYQTRRTHCPNGHPFDADNTRLVEANGRRTRACIECRRAAGRRWVKAHPEQAWDLVQRRRARLKQVPSEKVDRAAIIERFGRVCHLCNEPIPDEPYALHLDHVVPLSKGGPHTEDNLRPAHRLCNIRKSAKLIC